MKVLLVTTPGNFAPSGGSMPDGFVNEILNRVVEFLHIS
jgi:hypothetical protein